MMDVVLQFVPYSEIADLTSVGKIRKLLNIAKQDTIVILEGRLKKEEEAELIKTTMEEINKDFKGIELHVIYPGDQKADFLGKMKSGLANVLLGDRQGLTIIGPASIVKEIKKDPSKIQLLMSGKRKKKKK